MSIDWNFFCAATRKHVWRQFIIPHSRDGLNPATGGRGVSTVNHRGFAVTKRRNSLAIASNTGGQQLNSLCRNSRIEGYQGVSSPQVSQRQSGEICKGTHTFTPSPPAR